MKTITEKELSDMGRAPRKTRISLINGQKQVHFFTDEEILEMVKTGHTTLPADAEWITVVKD